MSFNFLYHIILTVAVAILFYNQKRSGLFAFSIPHIPLTKADPTVNNIITPLESTHLILLSLNVFLIILLLFSCVYFTQKSRQTSKQLKRHIMERRTFSPRPLPAHQTTPRYTDLPDSTYVTFNTDLTPPITTTTGPASNAAQMEELQLTL